MSARLRWLLAFAGCVAAVAVCVAYLDRPVADYSDAHVRGTVVFGAATRMFWSLEIGGAAAAIVLSVLALSQRMRGRDLGWLRLVARCVGAAVLALIAAQVLKFAIGRSQVDLWHLVDRTYAFRPFHGGAGYAALPSGMMSVTLALATVAWISAPALRVLGVLITLIIAAALIVTNGHWLGDIAAGAFVGAFIGSSVAHRG